MFKSKNKIDQRLVDNIKETIQYHSILSIDKLFEKFEVGERGLKPDRVRELLSAYGKNLVHIQKPPEWYMILFSSFNTPFNIILLILMVVSYVTGDKRAALLMGVMVFLSTILRFWQECKALMEANSLKKLVHNKTTVIRQVYEEIRLISKEVEIPMEELVPGDIIRISAGDMIPGDIRLISSRDLFVSESAITGEALPVEKHEIFKECHGDRYIDTETTNNKYIKRFNSINQPNMCFMGSSVVSGSAIAIVVSTGSNTYFGAMAANLLGKKEDTSFDQGVNKVGKLLIKFMIIMAPIVLLLNGILKKDWGDAFLFAVSVAVGLTPEMLPMILNANLARGAMVMSKKKTIVKKLSAIQNFGAMNILCTDKTGTLTQDKVVLIKYMDMYGNESATVLKNAFLNSYFQTGLTNLLDKAVITCAEEKQFHHISKDYKLIDEIPFDFVRRRMSVLLRNSNTHETLFVCKGAVEEILQICSKIETKEGEIKDITQEYSKSIYTLRDKLSDEGLRVVAVAYKNIENWEEIKFSSASEKDLIFSGYIAFLDPPKESTAKALSLLSDLGIEIKILTGDNDIVAKKICKDVGLKVKGTVIGPEIDSLKEEELTEKTKVTTIFAKLSPANKARIVRNLKNQNHTVGFMGDGINDALALREADIGISVDTGTDLAKESADIILLEKSLIVLGEGVKEGRLTFGNIIKYIKMTSSSNFGNVFSVLIASAVLPFLPMMPVQILIQNLLYDISQISIPWDRMDESFIKQPKRWEANSIFKFMVCIGPISSIFDIITFAVLWFIFQANSDAQQALFHSGWFVEGLITQTLIVHMIRTEKIPFLQSRASLPVVACTTLIIAIGLFLPFTSFAEHLGFVELPIAYIPWLVGIVVSYCIITQFCKTAYIKIFNSWL